MTRAVDVSNRTLGAVYLLVWLLCLMTFLPFPSGPMRWTSLLLLIATPIGIVCGALLVWQFDKWKKVVLIFTSGVLILYIVRWLLRALEAMDQSDWSSIARGFWRGVETLEKLISQFIGAGQYMAAGKVSYFEIVMPALLMILLVFLLFRGASPGSSA